MKQVIIIWSIAVFGAVAMAACTARSTIQTKASVEAIYTSLHQSHAACNPNVDRECPIEDVF